ncbi:MAG: hypothetical protein ACXQT5_02865 [Candidatus Syntropharchaeia archaeon]
MKIGIVSDSHGEVENLKDAVDWLVDGGAEKWNSSFADTHIFQR